MKKYLQISITCGLLLVLLAVIGAGLFFLYESRDRANFIARLRSIPVGADSRQLDAALGTPIRFSGSDVGILFPETAAEESRDFTVLRFSRSGFYLPVVGDFLIRDNTVRDKKIWQ